MGKQTGVRTLSELRGPQRWREEEGRLVVEAWEASGASVPSFAQRVGLLPQRVYWWKDRLRRSTAAKSVTATVSAPTVIPMSVRAEVGPPRGAGVTVVLSPEVRIEMAELDAMSAAWVATLVKSLREVLA
jgi:hypothetical protein